MSRRERLQGWLSVIGNLGLIATLVLVAIQINQNSSLVREQLYQQRYSDLFNRLVAQMGENPATALEKAALAPETLSYADHAVLDAFLDHYVYYILRNYQMGQRGMAGENDWRALVDQDYEGYLPFNEFVFGNAYAKAWAKQRLAGDSEMSDALIRHSERVDEATARERYEAILAEIAIQRAGAATIQ